jgi:hypothetical protein
MSLIEVSGTDATERYNFVVFSLLLCFYFHCFSLLFLFVVISFFSLIFVCFEFLVSLQFDSCTVRISTLRKRTFAHC